MRAKPIDDPAAEREALIAAGWRELPDGRFVDPRRPANRKPRAEAARIQRLRHAQAEMLRDRGAA